WQRSWGFWATDASNYWKNIPELTSQGTVAVQEGIIELVLPLNVLNHPSKFTIKSGVNYYLENSFEGRLDIMQGFVACLSPVTVDLKINGTTSAVTDAGGTLTLTCNSSPGGRTEFYYYLDKGVIGVLESEDIPVPGTFFEVDNSHTDEEPGLGQIKRTTEFNGPSVTGHLLIKAIDVVTGTSSYAAVDFTQPAYSQSISGEVSVDGSLAANIIVMAQSGDEEFVVITNSNGQYTLNLPVGSWVIYALMLGHPFSNPQEVYVKENVQKTGIDFDITTSGLTTICGVVTSDGKPAEGVEVQANNDWGENKNRNGERMSIMTDSSGNYTLHVKPDGTYTVRAKKAGYNSTPQGTNVSSFPASNVDFALTLNKSTIIGTVTGSGGILGAEISASTYGYSEQEAMTNLYGHYMVYVPEMSYSWKIEAGKPGTAYSFIYGVASGDEDVDLSLQWHDGTISGTVYAPGGTTTLGFVHVSADMMNEGIWDSSRVFSNPDGSYQLPVLAGQAYKINAYKEEYHYPGTIATTSASNVDIIMFSGPDLEIYKWGPGEVVPGCEISYDINFQNVSNESASNVIIIDTLPPYVTYVSNTLLGTPSITGSGTLLSPQVLTWNIGELSPMWEMNKPGYGYFTLVCRVGESLGLETTEISNVISISRAINEMNTANNQATWTSEVKQPYLELGISKGGYYEVIAGEEMTYWINYHSSSNVVVKDVVITDTLPDGVKYIRMGDSNNWLGEPAGTDTQVLTWNIPELKGWENGYFEIVVSVDAAATGTIVNTITITTLPGDADTSNNQAVSYTNVILPLPDLSIGKDGPWKTTRGSEITYSIWVNNYSRFEAMDVNVIDYLPQGVMYSTNTLGIEPILGTDTSGITTLHWKLGSLPSWESKYFQITGIIDQNTPGTLTNVVEVRTSSQEEMLENNRAIITTMIEDASFDLFINKGGSWWRNEGAVTGEDYTYYISFGNQGNTDVGSVTIVDTLPAGVSYVSNTNLGTPAITGSGTVLSPYVLTWEIDSLSPTYWGNYLELIVHLDDTITNGAGLVNVVNISTSMFGTETTDDNNCSTFTVQASKPFVDLVISKSGWPVEAAPGSEITYWISYSNQGNSPSGAGTITDTLPAGVTYVATEDNWWNKNRLGTPTLSSNILQWYFDSIEPGEWGWLQIKVKVDKDIVGTPALTNMISILPIDNNPDNNGASFTTQVVSPEVDMVVEKWGPDEIVMDDASGNNVKKVSYTIVLRNKGNSDAHDVMVVDTLPVGMTYATDTSGIPCNITGSGTLESPYQIAWNYGTLTMSGWREVVRFELIGTISDAAASPLTNVVEVLCPQDTKPDNNRATVTTYIVQPEVDLGIWKNGDIEGVPGQDIEYQVYYWNKGNANAHGVVIVDHLPTGLVYISDSCRSGNGTIATTTARGTKIRWEIGKLATGWGGYGYFTVRARIASDVTIGSILNNIIDIKSFSLESYPENNRATATITVVAPMADLCISKYAGIRQVAEGDTISYWIKYQNNGNSPATNVVITDYLPSGVSYGSDTLGITGTSTGSVSWNLGTVMPYTGGSFQLTLKVDEAVSTLLTNVIEITSETDEKNADDNRATSTVSVVMVDNYQVAETDKPEVDLVVRKDGPSQAGVGQDVVYYITYSNQGPGAASNVRITDTMVSGMSYVSDDSKLAAATINNQVIWSVGTVSGWSKKRFKMRVALDNNIPASSTLTNMVEIKTDSKETDYTNNKGTASLHVIVPEPDMVIFKWGEGEVTAGHKMKYQIRCINQGTGRATGVVIRDTLDNRVFYVSSTKQGTQTSNVITWKIGNIEPGESVDFSLTVLVGSMVVASTTLTNVVEVISTNSDSNTDNNRATVTTHVVEPIVDLSVYKFGSREVLIGKNIEYTINYANHSPSDAIGATITDTLDAGMIYVSNTSGIEPVQYSNKLIWAMGTISAWEVKSFKVTVSQSVAASTTLTNRVEITSLSAEDNLKNNQATCTTHVAEARVDVKVSKWGTEARPGFEKTYYITYGNIGTMQADNVMLIDKLDANVEYLLSSPAGSYDSTSHSLTWQIGSLGAQTDGYCQVVVRVNEETKDGVNIYNIIKVQTTSDESDYTNNKYTEVETVVTSMDPNDKVASPARCLKDNQLIDYTIHFENMATASASAILVKVIDRLDASSFDLSSMIPEEVGVGNVVYASVDEFNNSGRGSLTYSYNYDDTNGTITWLFNFHSGSNGLPPNVTPHDGEGFVNFSVKTKAGLSGGTIIMNTADIRFDYNEWMTTPATVHVVDFTPPVSNVLALAATQTNVAFDVSWAGTDTAGGTHGTHGAISSYSIEVADNGGQWTGWIKDTIATSSTFYGKAGHSYAFRSIAMDEAGNVEIKTGSDTSTLILSGPVFRITPATKTVSKGDSFSLEVELGCAPDFTTIETHLGFDPYLLEVTGISPGSFPTGGSVISATYTNTTGNIAYAVGLFSGTSSGTGTVMRITFKAKAGGCALISFNIGKSLLLNDLQAIPFNTENATVTINQMGVGKLQGYAVLDIPGVNGHAGVAVKIEGTSLGTTTDASGYFCIENVSPGIVYGTVSTYMPGASPRVWKDIIVPSNGTLTLGTLTLLNADADGKLADGKFKVDAFDFGYLRKAYFKNSSDIGWQDKGILTRDGYINCDFTGDGNVNAFDFGVLRLNFFKEVSGTYFALLPSPAPPSPSPAPPITKAKATSTTLLKVEPAAQDVLLGSTFTIGISLEDAPKFTAVDLRLCFNPSVLEVATLTFGGFPAGADVLASGYNNGSGTIDYGVGIPHDKDPATGTGQVLNITFRAKAIGAGMITFSLDTPRKTVVMGTSTMEVSFTPFNGTVAVRQNTQLMVGSATVAYGDNVELRGTLTDDDDAALPGEVLEFNVGGIVVGTTTTNASGVGTISYTASISPGTHTITVSYAGNGSYTTSSGANTLTVTTESTLVMVGSATVA
ncbi:MAG: carboxypeptidase regulatory-like domain-containing protein, partial [bacterium]|nr:carboxypeptidase regulatory-like domain-containing protein [bacterium]